MLPHFENKPPDRSQEGKGVIYNLSKKMLFKSIMKKSYSLEIHKIFKLKRVLSNMNILIPSWFRGSDILIELFSFVVLFIFFMLCTRYYKLNKKKNFLYLGIGFLLIAIAQIATICTKLVLYYDTTFTQNIGKIIITYHIVNSTDIFYEVGFFFFKLLTLIGFYIIYRLPTDKKISGDVFLALYFLFLSAIVGTTTEHLFHLTIIVLAVLIIKNYYETYKKNKIANTKILIAAFVLITISHLIFMIFASGGISRVIGEIVALISYFILLDLIIRIIRFNKNTYGKKKKSKRYNL